MSADWREVSRPTRPRQRSNSTPPLALPTPPQPITLGAPQFMPSSRDWHTDSIQSLNESLVESQSLFIQSLRDSSVASSSTSRWTSVPQTQPVASSSFSSFASSYEFSFISPPSLPPASISSSPSERPSLTFSGGTSVVSDDFESIEDTDLEDLSDRAEGAKPNTGGDEDEEDEMVMVVMRNDEEMGLEGCFSRTGKIDELSSLLRRTHLPPSEPLTRHDASRSTRTWSEGELDMGGLFE